MHEEPRQALGASRDRTDADTGQANAAAENSTVPSARSSASMTGAARFPEVDPRATGFFIGLMTGEGHFGGDGRQPELTLRMHTRHEALFRWLQRTFPGGRLYGPYHHGGRSYFQWMARGRYLREVIAPLVAANADLLDEPTRGRFEEMASRYGIRLEEGPHAPADRGSGTFGQSG